VIFLQNVKEFLGNLSVKFSFPFSGCYATVIHAIFKSSWVAVSKGLEDMVHKALHTGQGIGQTEAHYSWGVEPSGCFKGHEVLHFITVSNIPVAVA
jgi:hypothetical protein